MRRFSDAQRPGLVIGLVACCKTKLDRVAPVRELYTSPLFRMSLAYAEARCEHVYVTSAQHDLLDLDQPLGSYNRTMASLTPMQRKLFGAAVARGLVDRHGSSFDLLVLAGAAYVDPICAALSRMGLGPGSVAAVPSGAQVRLLEPLRGMQIGERLAWLSKQTSDLKPAERPVSQTQEIRP